MSVEAAERQTEGRCICGAVTVRVTGPMEEIWACHCDYCRRWSGGVQMGIDVPPARVEITGPVKTHQSTHIAQRAWCDVCGTAIYFRNTDSADADFELAPGLFDDFGGARLARISYADRDTAGLAMGGEDVERISKADYETRHDFVPDA